MGVHLEAKSFHGIGSQDVRVSGLSKDHEGLNGAATMVDVHPADVSNHGLPVRKLVFFPPLRPDAQVSEESRG
jgi:hypothetical protein